MGSLLIMWTTFQMFAWKLLAGLWRDWARKGSEVLSFVVFELWP
jgi:hypothetical protein